MSFALDSNIMELAEFLVHFRIQLQLIEKEMRKYKLLQVSAGELACAGIDHGWTDKDARIGKVYTWN